MVMPNENVMQRTSKPNLATIAGGDGVYLIDKQGNRYLDACGGAAVSCLGHSNQRVKQAIIDQVNEIPYAHTSFFTNDAQEQLAEHLLTHSYWKILPTSTLTVTRM